MAIKELRVLLFPILEPTVLDLGLAGKTMTFIYVGDLREKARISRAVHGDEWP
jgi:hypothetical protein